MAIFICYLYYKQVLKIHIPPLLVTVIEVMENISFNVF